MTFGKIDTKKITGIFDKNEYSDLVQRASAYWSFQIANAGERQLNFEFGYGLITVSDKMILKFQRAFSNYILKRFPKKGNIMFWTSDGANFDMIGTDNHLKEIMKISNLPITILPSDVCMWLSSDKIEVENNFQREVVYQKK